MTTSPARHHAATGTDPVRLAIVGHGKISDYHVDGVRAAGAEVVAVVGRDRTRARQAADRLGVPTATDALDEVLDRDDIAGVIVATPDATHRTVAERVAAAGKAVMVQKPMAHRVEDCRAIVEACATAGTLCTVSFMHRYFDEVVRVRELVAEGVLGDISFVRQRNAVPAPPRPWFYRREESGGAVMQVGVHGIDLVRHLFGEIREVSATLLPGPNERLLDDGTVAEQNIEDGACATYVLDRGTLVSHEIDLTRPWGVDRFRTEIFGTKGAAVLRGVQGPLAYCSTDVGDGAWEIPELEATPMGERQHRHFVDMIVGRAEPDGSDRDGVRATELVHLVHASHATDGGRVDASAATASTAARR